MTRRSSRRSPGIVLAAVIIALVGVYLGFRVWTTVREVLSPELSAAAAPAQMASGAVDRAAEKDARLAAVADPARDPFHAPRRAVRRTTTRTPEPEVERPPVIRMILFDAVSPEVQVEVGGALSGRLKVGSSFRGWTVVSVSENTVVVSKDGETHTLRL